MRLFLALLVLTVASACSKPKPAEESAAPPPAVTAAEDDLATAKDDPAPTGQEKTIEEMRAESLASIDRTACEGAGGQVRQEGMLGMYRCVKPYADAGKPCRGKADCEGQCRFEGEAPADGADVTGVCQRDDSPFGCYSEVEDGKLTGGICVD